VTTVAASLFLRRRRSAPSFRASCRGASRCRSIKSRAAASVVKSAALMTQRLSQLELLAAPSGALRRHPHQALRPSGRVGALARRAPQQPTGHSCGQTGCRRQSLHTPQLQGSRANARSGGMQTATVAARIAQLNDRAFLSSRAHGRAACYRQFRAHCVAARQSFFKHLRGSLSTCRACGSEAAGCFHHSSMCPATTSRALGNRDVPRLPRFRRHGYRSFIFP
jgi:hypothetical protein